VSFLIGEAGLFASSLNKPHLSYVVGTNDMDLFIQLAKAGKAVLLHQSLDEAYKILNSGMPENVFRLIAGKSAPKITLIYLFKLMTLLERLPLNK
jgi:hypothetical protein